MRRIVTGAKETMETANLLELLRQIKSGRLTPEEGAARLRREPFEDLGYAKIDHHRWLRQGSGEAIFGSGKTSPQLIELVDRMAQAGSRNILITRLPAERADDLVAAGTPLVYHPTPRLAVAWPDPVPLTGAVVVASAGTSDLPVAEEAALTAETLGSQVTRLYDVGVAGLHRLLAQQDSLIAARAIVAVAGMEGALPSVVAGLVGCPVVAVPTSVGYGANWGGLAALLAMLNSCANGVSVVNIDNGFGAGWIAHSVNRTESPT
ncbi:MAG: nickel pincer cofactor biosynthesis protein LarB [Propionibacteriaceae bacterium]|jgi:NCAIR mutase (PurE)-related protein|nr:nickel pincer cofactor biosynthesis protein LarB [Propionibacteriaceae bacterium]